MSKADLKAAMESLQVKKPLRLNTSAPRFKSPPLVSQDVSPPLDVSITKDASTSEDESRSQVVNEKPNDSAESAIVTRAQNEPQDAGKSRDIDLTKDKTTSQDLDISQVEPMTSVPRVSQPRRATEQDRAVTEATSVKSRLSTGYTRVPNSVLMEMVSGDLSRNEMKILLLIARMTISFNRAYVPLSKGVISRMTGIQGRSVLDALQTLHDAGLVEKLPGDCNKPNRLGLIFEPLPISTNTQVQKVSEDAIGSEDKKSTKGWDRNSTYKKDSSETIDLRKKISLPNLSENLRKYFSELKPRRKRETEFEAFEELRADYSEDEIEECLTSLREKGLPASGSACHSPMAYLSKAMAQLLPKIRADREKSLLKEKRAQIEADEKRVRNERRLSEEADLAEREREFEVAHPSLESQALVIAQYSKSFPMLSKGGTVLRNLAVAAWWEERKGR